MSLLNLAITEHHRAPYPYQNTQLDWLFEHADTNQLLLADPEGNTPLMVIVRQEMDDWYLRELLERGADLEAKNRQGMTALMQALDYNNLDAVAILLDCYQERGMNSLFDSTIEQGRLALFFAVYQGDTSAVDALLEEGTEVDSRNQWARTPLMLAAEKGQERMMRLLLERGAAVENVDQEGYTALALAAREDHAGCVRLLLEAGADPNTRAKSGWTPLIESAMRSSGSKAARLLLEYGADVHVLAKNDISVLSMAVRWDNKELVQVLLAAGAAENRQNLQCAIRSTHEGSATESQLLQAGATTGLFEAIARQDISKILHQILVEKADVNAESLDGIPPLLEAVYAGWMPDMSGTGIELEDIYPGWKPNGRETGVHIVRVLLEHGAEVNAVSAEGCTPLLAAICYQATEIALLLMEQGADVNQHGKMSRDCEEDTPMTVAPHIGNLEPLREMLRRGAEVNTQNSHGQTALMLGIQYGSRDVAALLIEHGANIHMRDHQGRTALMYAARAEKGEIVELLLAHGAQGNVRDAAGITALQLAQGWIGTGMIERLRAAGAEP